MADPIDYGWKLTAVLASVLSTVLGWALNLFRKRVDDLEQRVSEVEKNTPGRQEMQDGFDRVMSELHYIRDRIDRS